MGKWAVMLITLDRDRTIVEIDGKRLTDYTEGHWVPEKKIWYEPDRGPRPEHGYFGLQNYWKEAHVHFARECPAVAVIRGA